MKVTPNKPLANNEVDIRDWEKEIEERSPKEFISREIPNEE
jgi:hypothetical protein